MIRDREIPWFAKRAIASIAFRTTAYNWTNRDTTCFTLAIGQIGTTQHVSLSQKDVTGRDTHETAHTNIRLGP